MGGSGPSFCSRSHLEHGDRHFCILRIFSNFTGNASCLPHWKCLMFMCCMEQTFISISLRENSELEREIKTSEKIVKIAVIFPLYITVSS